MLIVLITIVTIAILIISHSYNTTISIVPSYLQYNVAMDSYPTLPSGLQVYPPYNQVGNESQS